MIPSDPDPDLIRRTLTGDTAAFGGLVDRYQDAVYGAAYAQVGNFHDAQDIAQEAFVQAYRRLDGLNSPDRFPSWLYTITLNISRDLIRNRRETIPLDGVTPGNSHSADEHDRRALHRRIQGAIASLSDIHRETVTLYYINGYTCDEVGDFLDVPVGTVKRRLSDARRKLKKEMIDMARDMFDANKLPSNFRKVVVDWVNQPFTSSLYLHDHKRRGFPVEISGFQGAGIYFYLSRHKDPPPRPITYDMFQRICDAFGIILDGIGITKVRKRFCAETTFSRGNHSVTHEADPGDALAMAVRFDAPVYVDQRLLEETTKQSAMIQLGEASSCATVRRTGGQIEEVRFKIYVTPKRRKGGKSRDDWNPPSERARIRGLSDRRKLMHVYPIGFSMQTDRPDPLIWLSDRAQRIHLPIAIGNYEGRACAAALPINLSGAPEGKLRKTVRPGTGRTIC